MSLMFPVKRVITTARAYTLEEIRDTLNQQGGFPSEAVIGGAMGSKGVYFITYKATDVWIRIKKDSIIVTERQMPRASNIVGGLVGGAIGGAIAGAMGSMNGAASWDTYFGRNKYKTEDIVYAVADKLQQLINSYASGFAPTPVNNPPAAVVAPAPVNAPPAAAAAPTPAYAPPVQPIASAPAFAPIPTQTAVSSASVLCTNGCFKGTVFPINGRLLIGRDASQCQVAFPVNTDGVSAMHCEVSESAHGIALTDRGSTYGTFLLSGRRMSANESVMLTRGDGFYLANGQNAFQII